MRNRPGIGRTVVAILVVVIVVLGAAALVLTQGPGQKTSSSTVQSSTSSSVTVSVSSSSPSSTLSTSQTSSSGSTSASVTFEMGLSPSTRIIFPGIIGNYTLSLTSIGGPAKADYTVTSALPQGFSAALTPETVSVANSSVVSLQPSMVSLGLTVTDSVVPGTYQMGFQVSGPGGSFNSTFPVTLSKTTVLMSNAEFLPKNLTVKSGTTVTWVNMDGYGVLPNDAGTHDVVFTTGTNVTSPALNQYDKYSIQLNSTGVYAYYCSFHPYMKAEVTVTP